MGHIRLGVLPKSPPWRTVITGLADDNSTASDIANRVLDNTERVLSEESSKNSISYCIWLLAQLTLSSRKGDFTENLKKLGISTDEQTKAVDFLSKVARESTRQLSRLEQKTAINNIAGLALREALVRTIGIQSNTLFDAGLTDIQIALRKYSSQKNFSELLHLYFTSFLSRTLRFVLDKEIQNQVGPGRRFESPRDLENFERSIDHFASQTSRIVDTFSGGWYAKQVWQQGNITESDTEKFVYIALKKLKSDLAMNEVQ